jgi:hypothetical protein
MPQALPCHVIDDVDDAETPTGELVMHEVERPAYIDLGLKPGSGRLPTVTAAH